MYRTGEDEKIQERFRSLRIDDERDSPSFARVLAGAADRRANRGWRLAPWMAMAGLALVAAITIFALTSMPTPSVPANAAGAAEETHPAERQEEIPTDTARDQVEKNEVETVPAVVNSPSRKAAKPDRPTKRQKPAPPDTCADC